VLGKDAGAFATLLRSLRDTAGLTQEELGERAGLTAHGISALERGARSRPYPHTVRSLAAALGADDDQLAALLTAARRRSEPTAPVLEAVRRLTPLIGRDDDVAAVRRRLADGARLVTLTGLGGVGKSRLAEAIAQGSESSVTVPLRAVPEARLVADAVAHAIGADGGATDARAAVRDALTGRRLLVVLDNVEHLAGAGAVVADLLLDSPGLAVLATSRRPLGIDGEQEHTVGPLPLPAPGAALTEVAGSPAGELLLARARAVQPMFGADDEDAEALAELCRRLGGLPLALEVAAARARVLNPAALLDRLDAVLGTPGDALPTALRWSYDQLGADAQALLRRATVLTGTFDVDAVEAVAGGVAAPLDALDELLQHALVQGPEPGGPWRFRVLEPVRQLAAGLLGDVERTEARTAAAQHFLELADEAAPALLREGQLAWMDRLEADLANLDASVEHFLAAGDDVSAARLVWSLWSFWWLHGNLRRGHELARRVAQRPLPPALGSRAASAQAELAFTLSLLDEAAAEGERAEELARASDDGFALAMAVSVRGVVALAQGLPADAHRFLEHALLLLRPVDTWGEWLASVDRVMLGNSLRLLGDPAAALASIDDGLERSRLRGDRVSHFTALLARARALVALGREDDARASIAAAAAVMRDTGDRGNLEHLLAWVAAEEGLAEPPAEDDPLRPPGGTSRIRIYARRLPRS